jgi:hypothetical protein
LGPDETIAPVNAFMVQAKETPDNILIGRAATLPF